MSQPTHARAVEHIFSIDVEEYFQVNAFEGTVSREDWPSLPSRVEASTDQLLELLQRHRASGTFFTLGWVADRNPALVRRIAEQGHEVASHGWWHRRIPTMTPAEFRRDVRESRDRLEQVTGMRVTGFRAPSFSILPECDWAFDVLLEEGYRYDSSVFPIRRKGYGWPDAPTVPFVLHRPAGQLLELPLATTSIGALRLPAAGGGYLRQLPFAIIRRAFRERSAAGQSAMFYLHPWEIDPGQPRLPVSWMTRVRHYRGLDGVLPRLERLLAEFPFTSVRGLLDRGGLPVALEMAA